MNSATSTDGSSFRAWHFFVVLTLLAATAAVLTSRIVTPEHLILLSLTVFAAGGTALALYRTLLPFAGRDTRLSSETLGHRARAALEREKMLVLRSIKELEFDRAMGKLAPGDYDDMSARLKLRALRLMQQLDADAVAPRERLERELAERLQGASSSASTSASSSASPSASSVSSASSAKAAAAMVCADCGAANDPDARFCKACGTRLAAADANAAGAGSNSGGGAGAGAGTSVSSFGTTLLLAGALAASGLLAPELSRPAFAQMPDLSQMSGQPLPSGDVPAGTISVRVVRQTMSNNVTGVEVQLEAPPQTLKATTDANGRAVFPNVAQGPTWKAVATVDGERLESQPFIMPAAGGLRMLLVAGLKTGGAAPSGAASGVAAPPAGGTAGGAAPSAPAVPGEVTLGGQSRFVIELAEQTLEVYGLFELTNLSSSSVMPANPIVFEMPAEAKTVSVLEGSSPNAKADGNRVTVNGPFAPGITNVQIAYRYPYSGGDVRVTQALPLALGQTTVILRKLDGVQFRLANGQGQRDVPLEGRMYVVLNGGAIPVGTPLDLTLSGLPHHSEWPTYLGIGLGALIMIGGGVLVFRGAGTPKTGRDEDARALKVRRATLFEQLVSLERRRTGKLRDDAGLMARRNELMSQIESLDETLAELALTSGTVSSGTVSTAPTASSASTVSPASSSAAR